MKKVSGPQLKLKGMSFEQLMLLGGYSKLKNGSYERGFENEDKEKYRFHIYLVADDHIEIHTDKIKRLKKNKHIHIASGYSCRTEKKRLKQFLPQPDPITKPPKPPGYKRNIFLPAAERKKLMENFNPMINNSTKIEKKITNPGHAMSFKKIKKLFNIFIKHTHNFMYTHNSHDGTEDAERICTNCGLNK